MKTIITTFLFALFSLIAKAESVEINGIYYNLVSKSKTAEVVMNSSYYSGDIIIPEKVEYEDVSYTVTSIGEYAFYGCKKLTSISLPNSITTIKLVAFKNCGLKNIELPNSVTSIANEAFWGCENLTSIYMSNRLKEVGMSAFNRCVNLKEVKNSNLEAWLKIDFETGGCPLMNTKLLLNGVEVNDLVIPDGITEIKNYSFEASLSSILLSSAP